METSSPNTKHTPGPWTLTRSKKQNKAFLSGSGWGRFCRIWVRIRGCIEDDATGIANTKLITAAPELLTLAQHIVDMTDDDYLSGHPEWVTIVDEAKSVIKKATE
jgi:hypothetical protein